MAGAGQPGGEIFWPTTHKGRSEWALNLLPLNRTRYIHGWIIKQTRNQCLRNTEKRKSIYRAMGEELPNNEDARHLQFQLKEQSTGYEVALEALRAIGWTPPVLYDAPTFSGEPG